MPTRNVVLTERHEELITNLVASGRYQNASEVLRDGLRLIEERDREEAAKLAALREAARVGFDDLDQGRYRSLRDDELEAYLADLGRRASARAGSTDR